MMLYLSYLFKKGIIVKRINSFPFQGKVIFDSNQKLEGLKLKF